MVIAEDPMQCPSCGRTFQVRASFEKHSAHCADVFQKKRPKFDARKMNNSTPSVSSSYNGPQSRASCDRPHFFNGGLSYSGVNHGGGGSYGDGGVSYGGAPKANSRIVVHERSDRRTPGSDDARIPQYDDRPVNNRDRTVHDDRNVGYDARSLAYDDSNATYADRNVGYDEKNTGHDERSCVNQNDRGSLGISARYNGMEDRSYVTGNERSQVNEPWHDQSAHQHRRDNRPPPTNAPANVPRLSKNVSARELRIQERLKQHYADVQKKRTLLNNASSSDISFGAGDLSAIYANDTTMFDSNFDPTLDEERNFMNESNAMHGKTPADAQANIHGNSSYLSWNSGYGQNLDYGQNNAHSNVSYTPNNAHTPNMPHYTVNINHGYNTSNMSNSNNPPNEKPAPQGWIDETRGLPSAQDSESSKGSNPHRTLSEVIQSKQSKQRAAKASSSPVDAVEPQSEPGERQQQKQQTQEQVQRDLPHRSSPNQDPEIERPGIETFNESPPPGEYQHTSGLDMQTPMERQLSQGSPVTLNTNATGVFKPPGLLGAYYGTYSSSSSTDQPAKLDPFNLVLGKATGAPPPTAMSFQRASFSSSFGLNGIGSQSFQQRAALQSFRTLSFPARLGNIKVPGVAGSNTAIGNSSVGKEPPILGKELSTSSTTIPSASVSSTPGLASNTGLASTAAASNTGLASTAMASTGLPSTAVPKIQGNGLLNHRPQLSTSLVGLNPPKLQTGGLIQPSNSFSNQLSGQQALRQSLPSSIGTPTISMPPSLTQQHVGNTYSGSGTAPGGSGRGEIVSRGEPSGFSLTQKNVPPNMGTKQKSSMLHSSTLQNHEIEEEDFGLPIPDEVEDNHEKCMQERNYIENTVPNITMPDESFVSFNDCFPNESFQNVSELLNASELYHSDRHHAEQFGQISMPSPARHSPLRQEFDATRGSYGNQATTAYARDYFQEDHLQDERLLPVQRLPAARRAPAVKHLPVERPAPVKHSPVERPAPVKHSPVERPLPVRNPPAERPMPVGVPSADRPLPVPASQPAVLNYVVEKPNEKGFDPEQRSLNFRPDMQESEAKEEKSPSRRIDGRQCVPVENKEDRVVRPFDIYASVDLAEVGRVPTFDLKQCPNCLRSFNQKSYEKHVKCCENVFGKKKTAPKKQSCKTPNRDSGTLTFVERPVPGNSVPKAFEKQVEKRDAKIRTKSPALTCPDFSRGSIGDEKRGDNRLAMDNRQPAPKCENRVDNTMVNRRAQKESPTDSKKSPSDARKSPSDAKKSPSDTKKSPTDSKKTEVLSKSANSFSANEYFARLGLNKTVSDDISRFLPPKEKSSSSTAHVRKEAPKPKRTKGGLVDPRSPAAAPGYGNAANAFDANSDNNTNFKTVTNNNPMIAPNSVAQSSDVCFNKQTSKRRGEGRVFQPVLSGGGNTKSATNLFRRKITKEDSDLCGGTPTDVSVEYHSQRVSSKKTSSTEEGASTATTLSSADGHLSPGIRGPIRSGAPQRTKANMYSTRQQRSVVPITTNTNRMINTPDDMYVGAVSPEYPGMGRNTGVPRQPVGMTFRSRKPSTTTAAAPPPMVKKDYPYEDSKNVGQRVDASAPETDTLMTSMPTISQPSIQPVNEEPKMPRNKSLSRICGAGPATGAGGYTQQGAQRTHQTLQPGHPIQPGQPYFTNHTNQTVQLYEPNPTGPGGNPSGFQAKGMPPPRVRHMSPDIGRSGIPSAYSSFKPPVSTHAANFLKKNGGQRASMDGKNLRRSSSELIVGKGGSFMESGNENLRTSTKFISPSKKRLSTGGPSTTGLHQHQSQSQNPPQESSPEINKALRKFRAGAEPGRMVGMIDRENVVKEVNSHSNAQVNPHMHDSPPPPRTTDDFPGSSPDEGRGPQIALPDQRDRLMRARDERKRAKTSPQWEEPKLDALFSA